MAIKLADAVVYLTADDGPLGPALNKAKSSVGSALGSMGSIAKTALTGAVVGGGLAAAGAIASIGKAAFDVSSDTRAAANDMAASLGIPIDEANRFADVAKNVFKNNFAADVREAGEAVGEVTKRFRLAADDPALQTMTENAFRLRDAYGVEVADSLDAVQTLMENFGISADEAFDMIALGYQRGLDRSGDFLDTIGEYSNQFASGGASAKQFFGLISSGLQGGVLGTDKAADAFKEFQVRIMDGSTATADSLALLGINSDEFIGKLSSGQMTVAEAFNTVTAKLMEVEDQSTLMQAGVGLLGTQFEDLGRDAAVALELNEDWAEGMEGSIDKVNQKYDSFGKMFEGMWRRAAVAVSPLTDKLLELANDAMPHVEAAFTRFEESVVPAIETVSNTIGPAIEFIKGLLGDLGAGVDGSVVQFGMFQEWFDANLPLIQETVETVLGWITAFWEEWGPPIIQVAKNTFDSIKVIIDTVLRTILDLVTVAMQLITGDFEGAGETLKGIVTRLWEAIKTIFSNQLNSIKTLITNFDLSAAGTAIINSLKRGIEGAWEGLVGWWRGKLGQLTDMLPSLPSLPSLPPWMGGGTEEDATAGSVRAGSLSQPTQPNPVLAGMAPIYVTVEVGSINNGLDAAYVGTMIAQQIDYQQRVRRR